MATRNDNMIAALLRERETYDRQGKASRVEQVDDQLHRLGYTPDPDPDDGPQGRTGQDPGQQSADAEAGHTAAAADPAEAGAPESEPDTDAAAEESPPPAKAAPAKKAAAARRAKG